MKYFNVIKIGILCLFIGQSGILPGKSPLKSSSDSIHAVHYKLYLDIIDFNTKIINGHAEIKITPLHNNITNICLDLFKLQADSVKINDQITGFIYNDTNIVIISPVALNQNDTVTVDVYYQGVPRVEPYGWGGFHFNGTTMAYNLGIAIEDRPPNYGRVWFPCIDNFIDKSTYDFYIRVPSNLTAVCNGTLVSVTPSTASTTVYHWQLNQPFNAYLASVAVSNYVAVEGTYNGINGSIPTQIYVKPQDTTKAKNSFINLNNILNAYEYYFGYYRWPRVGYVSTPQGAMEHVTNIAYPTNSIDGTLNSEWLYAHELSHMWFGDLVTCASQEDMWINEGWGVFCEILFREMVYGKENYKNNIRKKHHDVLQKTHITDNSYLALSPIPSQYVYGSTVYDKGGMVTHTLRGYLGDSIFFKSVKNYLNTFEYKSVSSVQLRDFLSQECGYSLSPFFDAWVFSPGFPHFSIDSVNVAPAGINYSVTVFVRQRNKGGNFVANNNHLPLRFLSSDWDQIDDSLSFSGSTGSKTFVLPFNPVCTSLDPEEVLSDATTDNYKIFKSASSHTFPDTYFSAEVTNLTDSAFLRVVHNWVPADTFPQSIPGLKLSDYRYWSVEGNFPAGFVAKGKFSYSKFNNLDNTLIINNLDSLVLLYRPSTAQMWQSVPFTMNGVAYQGELIVDTLLPGEYVLGIWDYTFLGFNELNKEPELLQVFPNPASGQISIVCTHEGRTIVEIYKDDGALIDSMPVNASGTIFNFNVGKIASSSCLIVLKNSQGRILASEKMLINH